jgi:nicotinic acid mononucleotide adenylyltransferase
VIAPMRDVDSTSIRELLRDGRDASHLLDPAVLAYIHQHGLYRTGD